ncbi:serine/threonine protein phosphatase [Streptomyces spongiicola]|uniref:Serine/threonine protein phosphatase n=1 Tax=Streptomyces spongiicola TaxID=1690221 RepID=A0A2S1Z4D3_9ACTN|nr:PP2C family protein-serine/threonine phosphatase [Streptomyces spongiicola]AWK10738.1 serine/threonine protein phosphatase [Streptomyces spongiicola]GBQ03684.1 serine/threonine protein phosphatase [Streptomyces spongiicola]
MRSDIRSSVLPLADGRHRVLWVLAQCLPFAIAVLVLVIELTPLHVVYTGPLLTATPALAAMTMGPVGTIAAAVFALVISVITAAYNEAWQNQQVYTNLLALVLVSAASITISSAARTRSENELNQIRRIAAAAQEVLLRPVSARIGPLHAGSLYVAAETGAQIGGDLYEAVQTRFGVRLVIGDVRGKGLPAVRAAAAVLGAFREAAHYQEDLSAVMDHCAAALERERLSPDVDPDARVEGFVTVLVVQVPREPVVEIVNRGHPPPLMLHRGRVEALEPGCPLPPLGLDELLPEPSGGKAESYPFVRGDRLLLHTDGVVEARNGDDDFFPLPAAFAAVRGGTPGEYLEELHGALMRHSAGSLADDVAMLIIERAE